ncbi:hypothetical protein N5T98_10760 [Aliarcobacter cryaerophilus]|uniref:hypothetical protein n=1 Tax=Aliarcobacter cryaerophilus TaxID=28198 RepID=UPI0021B62EF1|nr:hypothetical protein [Aliarcobacter cryaerophilus]MCT7487107.1 hypothetical protein [Aliarcobacter cryaerophilus]MCT7491579.1 hypothetical protein [Aliarcobacter cryaerophilus]
MVISKQKIVYILLLFLLLMNSFLLKILGLSSMTISTTTLVILVFLFSYYNLNHFLKLQQYFRLTNFMLIMFGFMIIFLIGIYNNFYYLNFDYPRFLFTYILLIFYIVAAFYISIVIKILNDFQLNKYIRYAYYILLLDGVISCINYYLTASKNMILFMEPSHYALILLPITLFVYLQSARRISILLIPMSIALMIQNLTLLVGLICFLTFQERKNLTIKITFILLLFALVASFYDFSYFLTRLNFTENVSNLSTLVFLSGWEDAFINFKETYGLGLGINQLGIIGEHGEFREILKSLGMPQLNLLDGGTTGSKIISECGIVGLIFLLYYFRLLYFSSKFIKIKNLSNKDYLMISFVITAFFELFLRGVGYFSPTMFMLLVSIFYLKDFRK